VGHNRQWNPLRPISPLRKRVKAAGERNPEGKGGRGRGGGPRGGVQLKKQQKPLTLGVDMRRSLNQDRRGQREESEEAEEKKVLTRALQEPGVEGALSKGDQKNFIREKTTRGKIHAA